jgi:2-polyprenyl-3-methyl-5-hydroxy-6-metoxy-1,4-benzoquinol methylase
MNKEDIHKDKCKICGGDISPYAHTAKCKACGALLNYPYLKDEELKSASKTNEYWIDWYSEAAWLNHVNFTNMYRFVFDRTVSRQALDILDYGGGGGQFALVAKSHMPNCTVYLTDICDDGLLRPWSTMNRQILFADFEKDETKFDAIFLNDVFEHVNDPLKVLTLLNSKLKEGGRIFIDTPKHFWVYPVLKAHVPSLYKKLLLGTVSHVHLQVWSKKSFFHVVKKAGMKVTKYKELTEFTREPAFYLKNMHITNPFVRMLCVLFYSNAKWLAKNKIMSVCEKDDTGA